MYLRKAPVTFVKDGERRIAYHTVVADELMAEGWTVEEESCDSEQQESGDAVEEVATEDVKEEASAPIEEEKPLEEMTKMQLLEWAVANNVNVAPYATKAEILAICVEAQNG